MSQKLLPEVLPTQESPLTYNYRTKLTPHFYIPNKKTGKDLPCPPNWELHPKVDLLGENLILVLKEPTLILKNVISEQNN